MGLHLVMPMCGSGSRFSEKNFTLPKPLIPIRECPFFYWAAESLNKFVDLSSLTFVVLREHMDKFSIDQVIRRYYHDAHLHILDHVPEGPVLTCLAGISSIKDNSPVLFNDCDHIFTCKEFYAFCATGQFDSIDGALLTFTSSDPKFSFLELDRERRVIRTVEKKAVSTQAICGAYYFRNRAVFKQAAEVYLSECTYNEFFVSGVYNIMARQNAHIRSFVVDMHLPFGTPEEYYLALKSNAFGTLL